MSAAYSGIDVSVPKSSRALSVRFRLRNTSSSPWSPTQGDALGFQILDAVTGNFILEGPRTSYAGELPPGGEQSMSLEIELPAEPGSYYVYVSPMRENAFWSFQRGAPFLLIEAETGGVGARVVRATVTTLARIRAAGLLRSAGRAFVHPVRTLVRHHALIRSMVRRDIVGRYRGSYGGLFWTVFHPLLLMLTYYFVFGVVLRTRFPGDDRPHAFALYFLAGMLPWLAFSEAVGRAPGVVIEHSNFVRKLLFPVETLPVNLVFAGLFGELFGVALFISALILVGDTLSFSALYLPLILVPQLLFTLGICWFLAALGVFFRDLGQIIGFLLTVWFFITPICYPEDFMSGYFWLYQSNPMYVLVKSYRMVLLDGTAPLWQPLAVLTAVSAALFVLGHAWFYRLKNSFADLV